MTTAEILETIKALIDTMAERKDMSINIFFSDQGTSISIYPMTGGADNEQ